VQAAIDAAGSLTEAEPEAQAEPKPGEDAGPESGAGTPPDDEE
jgi:hypothetical protein